MREESRRAGAKSRVDQPSLLRGEIRERRRWHYVPTTQWDSELQPRSLTRVIVVNASGTRIASNGVVAHFGAPEVYFGALQKSGERVFVSASN